MKKLLFMVSSFNIGGVEKSLLSLLNLIPKEKYEVTVLTLEKIGGFLDYVPEWVKVEEATWFSSIKPVIMHPPQQTVRSYIKKKHYIKVITFIFSYLLSKYFGKRFFYFNHVFRTVPVEQRIFDIAISYQGPTETIDYYIAKKIKAKNKFAWVHFDVSKHIINKNLYTKVYRFYDKVFAVSNEAKSRLAEKIPSAKDKAEIFQNVIDKNLIESLSKSPVYFDPDYKGIRIVTVGRLSYEKGQDLAIKVLKKLRDVGYEVRWYCVGEGKERRNYENLIYQLNLKNDFILLGATPNPYPYIARADIYVQTSRHEGYCLTLAEAKCLKKPIITTNFIGVAEQIANGYNGIIVNFDEENLCKGIKDLIESPQKLSKLTSNLEIEYDSQKVYHFQ